MLSRMEISLEKEDDSKDESILQIYKWLKGFIKEVEINLQEKFG